MDTGNQQDPQPAEDPVLWDAIHRELRAMAARLLRGEREGHTLQPTALVHEAYIKLSSRREGAVPGRLAFLRLAATAMRRILVDHARGRLRTKRHGTRRDLDLAALEDPVDGPDPAQVLDLAAALDVLEGVSSRHAQVVELRYFGGLSEEETAEVLGIHRRTVQESMRSARAWLREALEGSEPGAGP